jgi:Succinylglutamate desuccinylase
MQDFLQLTLSGKPPQQRQGSNAHLQWQWHDEGILSLTPPCTDASGAGAVSGRARQRNGPG